MLSASTTAHAVPAPDSGVAPAIRKARAKDVSGLLRLINLYAAQGIMLPRTEFEISENLRDFTVACVENHLLGCGALHFYTPTMGEIRSLAVEKGWNNRGIGKKLVGNLEAEARVYGLEAVFAFTYIPDFFKRLGFSEVERGALPLKAWKDCLRCPKFQCCDEIAVVKSLEITAGRADGPLIGGAQDSSEPGATAGISLPIISRSH
jgi:amino-acid N-acetyltransferase